MNVMTVTPVRVVCQPTFVVIVMSVITAKLALFKKDVRIVIIVTSAITVRLV
jgi:hypothetical protein